VIALLAALPGCVKHSVIADEPDTITIRVSNNNPLDMTVYAVNQSMRIRLGTVTTASTQRFEVSLHQVSPTGELQLLADPIGSRRTMRSESIHVSAGQVVEWILQVDLRQSSLTIRS
jgi:predicted acyl esterase